MSTEHFEEAIDLSTEVLPPPTGGVIDAKHGILQPTQAPDFQRAQEVHEIEDFLRRTAAGILQTHKQCSLRKNMTRQKAGEISDDDLMAALMKPTREAKGTFTSTARRS